METFVGITASLSSKMTSSASLTYFAAFIVVFGSSGNWTYGERSTLFDAIARIRLFFNGNKLKFYLFFQI